MGNPFFRNPLKMAIFALNLRTEQERFPRIFVSYSNPALSPEKGFCHAAPEIQEKEAY
jgi:hypothetical protein